MRTAFTVGIKDGKSTLITGTDVAMDEQKRAFNNTAFDPKEFDEVQYWESGRGMRGSRKLSAKGETGKTGVNFNSAHPVETQQDKKAAKGLRDLTPETAGKKAGVNWNAAHPVHLQQDKKMAKKLADLTPPKGDSRKKSGVNWDAVKPVDETKAAKKTSKKSLSRGAKKPSAKSNAPALPPPVDERREARAAHRAAD
jgi:hypothetical protein